MVGNSGMTPAQHRYSEAIYRINSELQSIRDENVNESLKDVQLQASFFDRNFRRFRRLLVDPRNWEFVAGDDTFLRACASALDTLFETWETKSKELANYWPYPIEAGNDGLPNFQRWEGIWRDVKKCCDDGNENLYKAITTDSEGRYHRAILALAIGRAVPPEEGIEGLVFQLVRRGAENNSLLKWVDSTLLHDKNQDRKFNYAPTESAAHFENCDKKFYFIQDTGKIFEDQYEFHNAIVDFLPGEAKKSWQDQLQDAVMRLGGPGGRNNAERVRRAVSIPIFDAGTAENPIGRLTGVVHALVAGENGPGADAIAACVCKHLDRLSIAIRGAARTLVAEAGIVQKDRDATNKGVNPAVHHFLRVLPLFQDWERVAAFREEDDDDYVPKQCWTRVDGKWEECPPNHDFECQCLALLKKDGDRRKNSKLMVMPGTLLELIDFPWLSGEEEESLNGYRFVFEFPGYTVLPTGERDREHLERQYWHELSDMWRIVVPKVLLRLRAEKEADRTAAVAIISRNMSHNLGSHPIATLAQPEKLAELHAKDLAELHAKDKDDFKGDYNKFYKDVARFLGYLRDRSDYIADIATSTPTWFLPCNLAQVVKYFCAQNLLHGHLATEQPGCEIKTTPAVSGKPENTVISVPHGVLGMQALYSIFENCLRNSVRYGKGNERGKLHLIIQERKEDYFLTVADAGSQISDENGERLKDEKGKARVNLEDLRVRLKKGFFDRERAGAADELIREDWGLKEMKISAAFLRGREALLADAFEDPWGTPGYEESKGIPWIEPMEVKVVDRTVVCIGRRGAADSDSGMGIELGNGGYLGWRTLLLKPRHAAIVGEWLYQSLKKSVKASAEKNGFSFHGSVDALKGKTFPEPFLIITDEIWSALANDHIRHVLPSRVIVVRPKKQIMGGEKTWDAAVIEVNRWIEIFEKIDKPEDFETDLYREWTPWLAGSRAPAIEPVRVVIADESIHNKVKNGLNSIVLAPPETAVSVTSCGEHRELFQSNGKGVEFVVFERHGREVPGRIHKVHLGSGETLTKNAYKNFWAKTRFYVAYESNDEAFAAIRQGAQNEIQARRLIEAGLVWLLVLDERLSKWKEGNGDLADLLARAGVWINRFSDETNIQENDLMSDKALAPLLNGQWTIKGRAGKLFVTIHHGILKGVYGNDVQKMLSWAKAIEEWGAEKLGPGRLEVVIHSGRGTPPELRKQELRRFKFLEFANLDRWIRRAECKPLVVDLLMALRSGAKERGE